MVKAWDLVLRFFRGHFQRFPRLVPALRNAVKFKDFMLGLRVDLLLWPYVSRPLEKGRPIGPDRNAP